MTDTRPDLHQIIPDLVNLHCPLPGMATAGQPRPEHFARLAAAGFQTVLDTRAPEEERGYVEDEMVRQAGLTYINIPVRSQAFDEAAFDQVRTLLRDRQRWPILVHCQSANRVGALLIPYLVLDEGKTLDEALAMAARIGLRNQELAERAVHYVARHTGLAGDDPTNEE